jgi:succinylglutamate desuccinylase
MLYEEPIEIVGDKTGETSVIVVGVHGNESCGVDALEALLPSLTIKKGRVIFLYGNPNAIEQKVRFIDANLNRLFRHEESLSLIEKTSYEYIRMTVLKKYLDQSSAVLDIHASLTPESPFFIIAEASSKDIVKYLPAKRVISGFDTVQPGGVDYYMNSHGKKGICVECGYFKADSSVENAKKCIEAFLIVRGHIEGDTLCHTQTNMNLDFMYQTQSDSFKLKKNFADFEHLSKGEIIGIDGEENICAPYEGFVLFARERFRAREEAFLFCRYAGSKTNKKGLV